MLEFLVKYEVILVGYGLVCVLAICGAFIGGFLLGFRFRRNIDRAESVFGRVNTIKPVLRDDGDEADLEVQQKENW